MDIQKLTLGEIAKVEELSGLSINEIGSQKAPQGKALAALVFVMKRRDDNKFTFADAMDLSMDEVTEILGLNDEDDVADLDPKETD